MKRRYTRCQVVFCVCFALFSISCFAQTAGINTERTSPKGLISFPLGASGGLAGGRFVDGYVKKYGVTPFVFPVGDNDAYRPFGASADATVGAYFQENPELASLPSGGPFPGAAKENTLAKISPVEFWDVDGDNPTKLTFTWSSVSNVAALTNNSLKNLTIAGWNPSSRQWEKLPSSVDVISILGSASSLTAGSITTMAALSPTTYDIYTLAGLTASGPLPVMLISFEAAAGEFGDVLLSWATSSEINSDQFEIQRSKDGQTWNVIGSVQAQGTSNARNSYEFEDKEPLSGQNLYRIRMVDKDETFAYSRVVGLAMAASREIALYPNPVSEKLFLDIVDLTDVRHLSIHDKRGLKLYSTSTLNSRGVDVTKIPPGTYLVSLAFANGSSSTHKIIITR